MAILAMLNRLWNIISGKSSPASTQKPAFDLHFGDRIEAQIRHCLRILDKHGISTRVGMEIEFSLPEKASRYIDRIGTAYKNKLYTENLRDGENFEFTLDHTHPLVLLARKRMIMDDLLRTVDKNRHRSKFFFESRHMNISFEDANGNLLYDEHPEFLTRGKAIAECITKAFHDLQPEVNKSTYLAVNYDDRKKFGYSANINLGTCKAASIAHRSSGHEPTARLEIRTPVYYGAEGETENTELLMLGLLAGAAYALESPPEERTNDGVKEAVIASSLDCSTLYVRSSWPVVKIFESWGRTDDGRLVWEESMFSPKRLAQFGRKLKIDDFRNNNNPQDNPELIINYRKALADLFNSVNDFNDEGIKSIAEQQESSNCLVRKFAKAMNNHIYLEWFNNKCFYIFGHYPIAPDGMPSSYTYNELVSDTLERMAASPVLAGPLTDPDIFSEAAGLLGKKYRRPEYGYATREPCLE